MTNVWTTELSLRIKVDTKLATELTPSPQLEIVDSFSSCHVKFSSWSEPALPGFLYSLAHITYVHNQGDSSKVHLAPKLLSRLSVGLQTHTVYCKLFEVEKFHGLCGSIGNRETFPVKKPVQ